MSPLLLEAFLKEGFKYAVKVVKDVGPYPVGSYISIHKSYASALEETARLCRVYRQERANSHMLVHLE